MPFYRSDLSIPQLAAFGVFLVTSNLFGQPPGGGPNQPEQKIVKTFDDDGDGFLNASERKTALEDLAKNPPGRRRGPRRGRQMAAGTPGPKVNIADAESFPNASFYDPTVLRTLFLEFESDNWEKELAAFKPTDVEVPAKLTVDGKEYPDVGVSFRGASSFFSISEGLKRSLNVSIDFRNEDQRLYGYKSLNLLNCNGDASMMSSVLYSSLLGKHIPTPKVNYVKVVINGESWGLYVSSQQFNKTFVKENFPSESEGKKGKKGARWKVPGSPRGQGGLEYTGESIEDYREKFEIKSKDKESSWKDLIELCRVLNETPQEQLAAKLEPILNVEGALWFLAMDVASVNSDGYWTRASDYNIYQDKTGKFHILAHDMNEAFRAGRGGGRPGGGGRPPGGFGGRGGGQGRPPGGGPPRGFGQPPGDDFRRQRPDGPPGDRERQQRGFGQGGGRDRGGRGGGGARGPELDPLMGLESDRMPLRSVLLSHPEWKKQYLRNVRTLATAMKWENIGPLVEQHRKLIEKEVKLDTRKLFTTDEFSKMTSSEDSSDTSLRAFLDKRSKFLLEYKEKSSQDRD